MNQVPESQLDLSTHGKKSSFLTRDRSQAGNQNKNDGGKVHGKGYEGYSLAVQYVVKL